MSKFRFLVVITKMNCFKQIKCRISLLIQSNSCRQAVEMFLVSFVSSEIIFVSIQISDSFYFQSIQFTMQQNIRLGKKLKNINYLK